MQRAKTLFLAIALPLSLGGVAVNCAQSGDGDSPSQAAGTTKQDGSGGGGATAGSGGNGVSGSCTSDDDCAVSLGGELCHVPSGKCVPCLPTNDTCPAGQFCSDVTYQCVTGCIDDSECADVSFTNATTVCEAGQCVIGACDVGFHDCNSSDADGCESNTSADLSNCGGCGVVCGSAHAAPTCVDGQCNLNCESMFDDCDAITANGCEVSIGDNLMHCGACFSECTAGFGGSPSCAAGVCEISCISSQCNCDNDVVNGCETACYTTTNCGGCGINCASNPYTLSSCGTVAGMKQCKYQCLALHEDCDNDMISNGCETNIQSDANHCGGCGNACPAGQTCFISNCQ